MKVNVLSCINAKDLTCSSSCAESKTHSHSVFQCFHFIWNVCVVDSSSDVSDCSLFNLFKPPVLMNIIINATQQPKNTQRRSFMTKWLNWQDSSELIMCFSERIFLFFILTNVKCKIKTLNNDYFFADLSTFGISKQSNWRLLLSRSTKKSLVLFFYAEGEVMLVMQEIKLGHFSQYTNNISNSLSLSHLL